MARILPSRDARHTPPLKEIASGTGTRTVARSLGSYVAVVAYADGAIHDYVLQATSLSEAE
jgi:hypothetical protein